jgi:hypothetical protein
MSKERMTVTPRHAGLDGPSHTPGVDASTDTTVDGLEPIGPELGGLDGADAIGLDDDPFGDDDLESKLQARAPFPVTRTTAALAGLVLVVAGFLGGVLVQKNFGTAASSNSNSGLTPAALSSRAAAFGNFGNRGGGTGGSGNNGGTGGTAGTGTGTAAPTTGKITLVDGTTVYVTTSAGDVVIIKTNSSTTVRVDQTVTLKQLTVGSTVTVTGTTASDGSVTATTITQQK